MLSLLLRRVYCVSNLLFVTVSRRPKHQLQLPLLLVFIDLCWNWAWTYSLYVRRARCKISRLRGAHTVPWHLVQLLLVLGTLRPKHFDLMRLRPTSNVHIGVLTLCPPTFQPLVTTYNPTVTTSEGYDLKRLWPSNITSAVHYGPWLDVPLASTWSLVTRNTMSHLAPVWPGLWQ